MTQEDKELKLKYRAVCPMCHKPFDLRTGKPDPVYGTLCCPDCFKQLPFRTYRWN